MLYSARAVSINMCTLTDGILLSWFLRRPGKKFKRKAENHTSPSKASNPKKFAKENKNPKAKKNLKAPKGGFKPKTATQPKGKLGKGKFRKKSFSGDKNGKVAFKRKHAGDKGDESGASKRKRMDLKTSDDGGTVTGHTLPAYI